MDQNRPRVATLPGERNPRISSGRVDKMDADSAVLERFHSSIVSLPELILYQREIFIFVKCDMNKYYMDIYSHLLTIYITVCNRFFV